MRSLLLQRYLAADFEPILGSPAKAFNFPVHNHPVSSACGPKAVARRSTQMCLRNFYQVCVHLPLCGQADDISLRNVQEGIAAVSGGVGPCRRNLRLATEEQYGHVLLAGDGHWRNALDAFDRVNETSPPGHDVEIDGRAVDVMGLDFGFAIKGVGRAVRGEGDALGARHKHKAVARYDGYGAIYPFEPRERSRGGDRRCADPPEDVERRVCAIADGDFSSKPAAVSPRNNALILEAAQVQLRLLEFSG